MPDPFEELAAVPRWVVWRQEERGGKPTKVPYNVTGGRAKTDDPSTWAPRLDAERQAKRWLNGAPGGVGVVLGDLGGDVWLAGLDLDSSVDDGLVADWAAEILATVRSYCEVSPSGRGLKMFFYAAAEDVREFLGRLAVPSGQWGLKRGIPGLSGADHGPGIELYCSHRYFTVTRQCWSSGADRIVLLDRATLSGLAALIPAPVRRSGGGSSDGRDTSRSAKAFRFAMRLDPPPASLEALRAALDGAHDPDIRDWAKEKGAASGGRELRRLWGKVSAATVGNEGVGLADFFAYMPMHKYIFAAAREIWPGSSVNARVPGVPLTDAAGAPVVDDKTGEPVILPASVWLDKHRPVEQMFWAPGEPTVVADTLVDQGGTIARAGVSCFNLYRPPPELAGGDPENAGRWVDHLRRLYPETGEADHIRLWFAHRLQRPADKINHALVLGGEQGIGKDSLIEPLKRALGPWNCHEIAPRALVDAKFNGFARSLLLRISEARDLGEVNRYAFYEASKVYLAAPPDVLRVNEKNLREFYVLNCCGVVITTNYKANGIYLPADDRRHFVAWSTLARADFLPEYWQDLWNWYENGGIADVAAHLAGIDLAAFNPKAPPPKTAAFWDVVNSNCAPEDAELADLLDRLGNPDVVTVAQLVDVTRDGYGQPNEFGGWLCNRKSSRLIPHRLEACGYAFVRNPASKDGVWKLSGRRQFIYGKVSLSLRDQVAAIRRRWNV